MCLTYDSEVAVMESWTSKLWVQENYVHVDPSEMGHPTVTPTVALKPSESELQTGRMGPPMLAMEYY